MLPPSSYPVRSQHAVTNLSLSSELWPAFSVGLIVFVICALTAPRLESPLHDEWCYTHIVTTYAATGRLDYFGCSAAILGPQLWLGVAVVKWFGFSFFGLRLLITILAGGCAAIQYLIARRLNIPRPMSVFASLALMLSPVVYPTALLFITDIPALLLGLLTIWIALSAQQSRSTRQSLVLLVIAFLCSTCAGSIRQFFFLLPILLFLTLAITRYRDRPVAFLSAGLALASIVTLVVLVHWYNQQPNAAGHVASLSTSRIAFTHPFGYLRACAKEVSTTLLYLLPVSLAFVSRGTLGRIPLLIATMIGIIVGIWWPLPQMGDMVTAVGYLGNDQELIGARPIVLGGALRLLLTVLTAVATAAALRVVAGRLRSAWDTYKRPLIMVACLAPFVAAYYAVVASRYPSGLYDRYLIPALSVTGVALLVFAPRRANAAAWATAAVFFIFSRAAVHDYAVEWSARLRAANGLVASGVDRITIAAGYESDMLTHLRYAGRISDDPNPATHFLAGLFYLPVTIIHPDYYIIRAPIPGLRPVGQPLCFKQFLPPFKGCVVPARAAR
jgi:Dolichyl-phosphate-mannose-protein mannosyltransferase